MVRKMELREVFAKLQKEEYTRVIKRFKKGTPRGTRIAEGMVAGRVSCILSQLCRE